MQVYESSGQEGIDLGIPSNVWLTPKISRYNIKKISL